MQNNKLMMAFAFLLIMFGGVWATNIADCTALSTANGAYVLTANTTTSEQSCMNVSAVNVSLNCNGFTIRGNNGTDFAGVNISAFNASIKNCNIVNWSVGIRLSGATYSLIQNNTILVSLETGYGINITSASANANITNNSITLQNLGHGIYIDGGINASVDCTSGAISGGNNSTTYGVYSTQANTSVKNCLISGFQYGIGLVGARGGTFTSNTITLTHTNGYAINATNSTANNTFLTNILTSQYWVNNSNDTNRFNSSSQGNKYYFYNGTGSWAVFNITCSESVPCYADGGAYRPFNFTTVGANWSGVGYDYFPYSLNLADNLCTSFGRSLTNNITAFITGTFIPMFGFVIAIALIAIGWGYAKNMFGNKEEGQSGY